MAHTTTAPPVDLPKLVPGIEKHLRHTVRLHPRQGSPGVRDSHVGGPLLWPETEPWPRCGASSYCALDADDPMIAVAQFYAADLPEIPFPSGTDLVQILWCGGFHDRWDGGEPVRVRWRRSGDVGPALSENPLPEVVEDDLVPRPCVVDPERVTEYPWYQELPDDVLQRLRAFNPADRPDAWYPDLYDDVATATGFRVGGSMNWSVTDMPALVCSTCRSPLFMLLHLDTCEWYPGSHGERWQPVEEHHLEHGSPEYDRAREPTGMVIGRASRAGVFVCSATPDHPAAYFGQ